MQNNFEKWLGQKGEITNLLYYWKMANLLLRTNSEQTVTLKTLKEILPTIASMDATVLQKSIDEQYKSKEKR